MHLLKVWIFQNVSKNKVPLQLKWVYTSIFKKFHKIGIVLCSILQLRSLFSFLFSPICLSIPFLGVSSWYFKLSTTMCQKHFCSDKVSKSRKLIFFNPSDPFQNSCHACSGPIYLLQTVAKTICYAPIAMLCFCIASSCYFVQHWRMRYRHKRSKFLYCFLVLSTYDDICKMQYIQKLQ